MSYEAEDPNPEEKECECGNHCSHIAIGRCHDCKKWVCEECNYGKNYNNGEYILCYTCFDCRDSTDD